MVQSRHSGAEATATVLERFYTAHPQWSAHTLQCYRSVLEAFNQNFATLPSDPIEIITWVRDLESLYRDHVLKTSTRLDYYERIKYLYRWAGLPDLPYQSFAERRWKGQK